jgi:hypothetical protein
VEVKKPLHSVSANTRRPVRPEISGELIRIRGSLLRDLLSRIEERNDVIVRVADTLNPEGGANVIMQLPNLCRALGLDFRWRLHAKGSSVVNPANRQNAVRSGIHLRLLQGSLRLPT